MKAIILLLLLLVSTIAFAQDASFDDGQYNFASLQIDHAVSVSPGNSTVTKLYFYNIFGNRITHVKLSISEFPQGYTVTMAPAVHQQPYSVAGTTVFVEENLFAEPTPRDSLPQTKPNDTADVEYIQAPSISGWIPAKPVKITISAPPGAPIGQTGTVKVIGTANWLGNAGTVSLNQEREFTFTVTTVAPPNTIEVPITGSIIATPTPSVNATAKANATTNETATAQPTQQTGLDPMLVGVGAAVIVIIVAAIFFATRHAKPPKKEATEKPTVKEKEGGEEKEGVEWGEQSWG